jgi:hypothetical protein
MAKKPNGNGAAKAAEPETTAAAATAETAAADPNAQAAAPNADIGISQKDAFAASHVLVERVGAAFGNAALTDAAIIVAPITIADDPDNPDTLFHPAVYVAWKTRIGEHEYGNGVTLTDVPESENAVADLLALLQEQVNDAKAKVVQPEPKAESPVEAAVDEKAELAAKVVQPPAPKRHGPQHGDRVAYRLAEGERPLNGQRRFPATVIGMGDDGRLDLKVHYGATAGDGYRQAVPKGDAPGCWS